MNAIQLSQRALCAVLAILSMIVSSSNAQPFSDLIVFGDSLEDVGNLNSRFSSVPPVPPYFEGRFSNGPVWVEKLAERLNVGPLVASEGGGRNYAWGGATTGSIRSGFADDMDQQVQRYLSNNIPQPEELFILSGGFNDISNGQTDAAQPVQYLSEQISQLVSSGATNFLVATVPRYAGSVATQVNTLLSEKLNELRTANQDVSIVEFDLAGLFDSVMADPTSFGFAYARLPACKDCDSGNPPTTPTNIVANPDEHFFWDNSHPSASAHVVIGDAAYSALISEPALPGDFNGDGALDVNDIDSLIADIAAAASDPLLDLTGDGVVDTSDVTTWLSVAAEHNGYSQAYLPGDSDLDGSVNSTDLNNLALSWRQDVSHWSTGDFTADGVVDALDLNQLALNWQRSIPVAGAQSVPEPSTIFLLGLAAAVALMLRRSSIGLRGTQAVDSRLRPLRDEGKLSFRSIVCQ